MLKKSTLHSANCISPLFRKSFIEAAQQGSLAQLKRMWDEVSRYNIKPKKIKSLLRKALSKALERQRNAAVLMILKDFIQDPYYRDEVIAHNNFAIYRQFLNGSNDDFAFELLDLVKSPTIKHIMATLELTEEDFGHEDDYEPYKNIIGMSIGNDEILLDDSIFAKLTKLKSAISLDALADFLSDDEYNVFSKTAYQNRHETLCFLLDLLPSNNFGINFRDNAIVSSVEYHPFRPPFAEPELEMCKMLIAFTRHRDNITEFCRNLLKAIVSSTKIDNSPETELLMLLSSRHSTGDIRGEIEAMRQGVGQLMYMVDNPHQVIYHLRTNGIKDNYAYTYSQNPSLGKVKPSETFEIRMLRAKKEKITDEIERLSSPRTIHCYDTRPIIANLEYRLREVETALAALNKFGERPKSLPLGITDKPNLRLSSSSSSSATSVGPAWHASSSSREPVSYTPVQLTQPASRLTGSILSTTSKERLSKTTSHLSSSALTARLILDEDEICAAQTQIPHSTLRRRICTVPQGHETHHSYFFS